MKVAPLLVESAGVTRQAASALSLARFMIGHHAEQGRKPVWGSAQSNPPSALLAGKLGFTPVDRVRLFTRRA